MTLRSAARLYCRERVSHGYRESSFRSLELWIAELGRRQLGKLTAQEIQAAGYALQDRRRWAPATLNRAMATLSGLLTWAHRRGMIPHHPLRGMGVTLPVDNARERWLTPSEVARLVAAADPWLSPLIRFATLTGLRLGELVELRKDAVFHDQDERMWLTTERTKNRQRLFWPLEGWARDEVKRRVTRDDGPLLFPGPDGSSARSAINRAFPRAVKAAGLPYGRGRREVSWHTLRHTFASQALAANIPAHVVQKLGNWKDSRMLQRYGHLADESLREAARVISKVSQKLQG